MPPTLSYILPTRDRPGELARTLEALGAMGPHDAEVIVVDNASVTRPHIAARLSSGVPVAMLGRPRNDGAAARNFGARVAAGQWLVMLDDDSAPTCDADTLLSALERQPDIVAAVMADIRLPAAGTREAGGLPEVFIGCGVAIRRDVFLALEGYDPAFNYYVEEYDLAARMLLDGLRIAFEPSFTVKHRKVTAGRDMDLILQRLVRNNSWVMQRYAPEARRREELRHIRTRYRGIARKEGAVLGYGAGLSDLRSTLASQPRREMPAPVFARFTGLTAVRQSLDLALASRPIATVSILAPGKNQHVIRQAVLERGVRILESADPDPARSDGDLTIIGTLSPGSMIDAARRHPAAFDAGRLILPWTHAARVLRPARASLSVAAA